MKITITEKELSIVKHAVRKYGKEISPAEYENLATGKSWEVDIPDEDFAKVRDDLVWQVDTLISRFSMILQEAACNFRRT